MNRSELNPGPCDQPRRSFLKLSALLGLGAATSAFLPTRQAEALLFAKDEYKVSETRLAMSTFVSITAIHPSRDEAENAIGLAFEEINRLVGLLSRYDSSSPVYQLNENGKLRQAPAELLEVVARALYFHRQSNGAFDITVAPVINLYKKCFAAGRTPEESEISALLPAIGSQYLRLENGEISFLREKMAITLDGIAKGYIVDRASALLSAKGISNHLVNAGGQINTRGTAAKGEQWTVAIQDPRKHKQYPDIIRVGDSSIATSGNYEVFFDNEKIYHHIIDPHSGHSPRQANSVTTKAASGMDADALAKVIFVGQPTTGVSFVKERFGAECFVLQRDGSKQHSSGWQGLG